MDAKAETRRKPVDKETDEIGIGVMTEEVGKDRHSDGSEDSGWHFRTETENDRWKRDVDRRRRCRCGRRRIYCGNIGLSRGTGGTRKIRM